MIFVSRDLNHTDMDAVHFSMALSVMVQALRRVGLQNNLLF